MGKPKIRFKGYTDEWEQRKFGEITELKSASRVHKDEWTSNGVPFYRSSDVMAAINGTENEKAYISEELYEKLSKVSGKLEEGDILVTGGGSVGNPYIVPDNKPLYTKDADLLWIKNKGKFHPYFLYEFFFSPTFRNYLGSISHVGTIAHYTITQLSDTPICLPSFEEQKEVGEYFQSLDNLITLHQRKCNETKKLKKYMLQKMFPQNGEKVPEVRFSGFTDDWEQRKLGDILEDMYNGQTPSRNRSEYWNGKISWLSSGELNRGIVSRSIETITTKGKESANLRLVPKGTFVMAITGLEAAGTRGNCTILGFDTTLNQSCMALFPKEDLLTPNFLFQWYRKVGEEYGINYTQGTKQQSYNAELIKILPISLPSVKEQEKIAGYLENLDALITLHQQKCDELRDVKKYMLQNMFI